MHFLFKFMTLIVCYNIKSNKSDIFDMKKQLSFTMLVVNCEKCIISELRFSQSHLC